MPRPSRILIISSSNNTRNSLKGLLTLENFEVRLCANDTQSIKIAKSTQPDLILYDASAPEDNRFAALKALRVCSSTCHIPVLFLVNNKESINFKPGQISASDSLVAKPVQADKLLRTVRIYA